MTNRSNDNRNVSLDLNALTVPPNVMPTLPDPIFSRMRKFKTLAAVLINTHSWRQRFDQIEDNRILDDMKKDNESIEKDKKNNQNDLDSTLEYISLTLKASIAGLFLCIGLISLIIGGTFFSDCPAQRNIPVWLIVSGVILLIICTISLSLNIKAIVNLVKRKVNEGTCIEGLNDMISVLVGFFLFSWFIAGNVWVYGTNAQYDRTLSNYCNQACYMYAYTIIIIVWILLGIATLFSLFILLIICCVD